MQGYRERTCRKIKDERAAAAEGRDVLRVHLRAHILQPALVRCQAGDGRVHSQRVAAAHEAVAVALAAVVHKLMVQRAAGVVSEVAPHGIRRQPAARVAELQPAELVPDAVPAIGPVRQR